MNLAKWTTYECGYHARLQGCYRMLWCYRDDQELAEWLRGWDAANIASDGKFQ